MTAKTTRRLTGVLLLTASSLAIAAPAQANSAIYASDPGVAHAAEAGERVNQQGGLTQIRLDNGGVASFVDGASFQIRADGSIDLFSGSVTVSGGEGGPVVVHLAGEGEGRVEDRNAAASFSVTDKGDGKHELRGHVLNGAALIALGGGNPRRFESGQMWHSDGGRAELAVANGAASVPAESADTPQVADSHEGGPAAAAANGVPVVLGDALAAAGASGDVVAAARRVQAAAAAPALETFPSGDLALLVGYAGRLNGAYGGQPFNGAAADIIRTYLQYLANGGSGAQFLTTYAGFMTQYLDLMRTAALPSSFKGASVDQINAFIAYRGRVGALGSLSAQNKVLVDAYLAFIQGGGNADQFVPRYTSLTDAYFAFLRGGGDPAAFSGASTQTINAYLTFLRDSGLLVRLTQQNQALLNSWLASLAKTGSGYAFADQYRVSLNAYFTYLQEGRLPSGYSAADIAQLRAYLETLQSTGLFDRVLGAQAQFYAGYLAHLQAGGSVDSYAGLPANVFAGYATSLNAYYAFLKQGGVPSAYTALTQAQISAYLAALQGAGAYDRFLGDLSPFWGEFYAYLAGGGNPDLYAKLPVPPNYPAFADALNAYAAYLSGGGLPSGYTALSAEKLKIYIDAIIAAGRQGELLGANSALLTGYFTYLANGGAADRYAGLPVYANYTSALNAYYAYLSGGGLPSGYSALTVAQLQAYIKALIDAGVYNTLLAGDAGSFLNAYYAYLSTGGSANGYTGLPVYSGYVSALNAYYAFLAGGGLPSGYSAASLAQLQAYLKALVDAGVYNSLLSGDARTFLADYYSFVAGGGTPNGYKGLPVYASYTSALNAYYTFLQGGGLPSAYSALTLAQIQAYLKALVDAGVFNQLFSGASATFFDGYYTYVAAGGVPNSYTALPVNSGGGTGGTGGTVTRLTAYSGGFTGGTGAKVFATNAGNSQPGSAAPTVDTKGALVDAGSIANVNATATDIAGDSRAIVGRLTNGTAKFNSANASFTANGGLPYVVLAPIVGSLPTSGTIDYAVLAATQPVYASGTTAPGTFSGTMTIGFNNTSLPTYRSQGTIVMPESGGNVTYTYATPGYDTGTMQAASESLGGLILRGNVTGNGVGCTGTGCTIIFYGNFAGSNPQERLGLTYQTYGGSLSAGRIQGAVIFAPGTSPTPTPAPTPTPTPTPAVAAPTGTGMIAHSTGALPVKDPISGQNQYNNVTVTALSDGRLTLNPDGYARGTATETDTGTSGGVIAWTRWAGGTATKTGWVTLNYAANGGVAFVWAKPATSLPTTGTATYQMIGGTKPFIPTGTSAPGTVDSASLAVAFATRRVGFTATITQNGASHTFGSTGGTAAPSMGIGTDMTFSGTSVNGAETFNIKGLLAGTGATHAAVSYLSPSLNDLSGVIVFSRDGSTATTVGTGTSGTSAPTGSLHYAGAGAMFNASGTIFGSTLAQTDVTPLTALADGQLNTTTIAGDTFTRGTAANAEFGHIGATLGWARWGVGTVTETTGTGTTIARTIQTNGGYAHIWGAPVTNLPTTGRVTYVMHSATQPIQLNGAVAPGTVDSASLAVDFAKKMVGFEASVTMPNATYSLRSLGGIASPDQPLSAGNSFNGGLVRNGSVSSGSFVGFLAGDGASNAGVAYQINSEPTGVTGVIAFTKP